jgi:hypothetical protein
MDHEDNLDGMAWLDQTFKAIAHEAGLSVEEAGWLERTAGDRASDTHRYGARVGGKAITIPFGAGKLAGLPDDPSARLDCEALIAQALEAVSAGSS